MRGPGVISLRKLLEKTSDATAASLFRSVHLLLQGAALHSLAIDPAEHNNFREDMARLVESLEQDPSPENVLLITGAANKTIEEYNRRIVRQLRMQHAQMHEMIAMLSKTIAELGGPQHSPVAKLLEVEKQLESATAVEDLVRLKSKLSESLRQIREEFAQQREQAQRAIEELKQRLHQCTSRLESHAPDHSELNFPGREEAAAAIRQLMQARRRAHVALFAADNYRAVLWRFKNEVAAKLMQTLHDHLASRLGAQDRFFIWRPGSLLALITRSDDSETLKLEITTALATRLEINARLPQREVLLPIHTSWTLVALISEPSPEAVFLKLDQFLASRGL